MLKNKSLLSLLGSNFAVTIIGLVTGLILAKYASLEVRGEIGKILIWITFGINLITVGTIEYYFSGGNNKRLVINKPLLIVVGLILIFLLSLVFYFNNFGSYIYYILLLVPMNLYSLYRISELNLCGYFIQLSIIKIIQPLFYALILIGLILFDCIETNYILWANLFSNFALILYLFILPKLQVKESNEIKFSQEWLLVNFSAILGVIVSNFDKVYISSRYSLQEVALYLVGLTLVGAPISIIGQTYAAKFIYGNSKDETYRKNITTYFILTLLICLAIYLISPFLLSLLFDGKYDGILNIILALIVLSFLINFRLIIVRILRNLGFNKKILKAEILLIFGVMFFLILLFFNIKFEMDLFIKIYSGIIFLNILYLALSKKEMIT